jgi:choloylglycine hydrolase
MHTKRHYLKLLVSFLIMLGITGCATVAETPTPLIESAEATSTSAPILHLTPTPTKTTQELGDLTEYAFNTLKTLEKVHDYPLYTMTYHGEYHHRAGSEPGQRAVTAEVTISNEFAWGCSLFAAFGDEDNMLYGRNFDWEYSPALLLFTNEPGAYASVSMVDIAYLGFGGAKADTLLDLPLSELEALLDAPFLPFDGMNETGLVIGMAAVPPGNMQVDPERETIGSLRAIREMLDYAGSVDEALEVLRGFNIDMGGGPPLHYLIADDLGNSVLVEFYEGEMVLIPNEAPWHQATNFLRSAVGESTEGVCWRHDAISVRLQEMGGRVPVEDAFDLLENVSQVGTQWSVVYEMARYQVHVVMGRQYDNVNTFETHIPCD